MCSRFKNMKHHPHRAEAQNLRPAQSAGSWEASTASILRIDYGAQSNVQIVPGSVSLAGANGNHYLGQVDRRPVADVRGHRFAFRLRDRDAPGQAPASNGEGREQLEMSIHSFS